MWDENSPFYKIGGWKNTKSEFNEIIYGTFTKPKYILLHLKASFKATLIQLTRFAVGDGNGSFLNGTSLYERVFRYFSNDIPTYTASKQNRSQLNLLPLLNVVYPIVIIVSLLFLVFSRIKLSSAVSEQTNSMMIILFLGVFLNAWDCGTFANAIDRLGCKVIWLVPLMMGVVLSQFIHSKHVSLS
ncbi:MAG: hypothetical protein RML94_05470 [Bacteroidia bacterium]|nr:hypothetical protein [Bacteroidia bacterium]